jgi:hypothetical protein
MRALRARIGIPDLEPILGRYYIQVRSLSLARWNGRVPS